MFPAEYFPREYFPAEYWAECVGNASSPKFPGSAMFESLRMTATIASLHYTGAIATTRLTGEFRKGQT